MNIIQEIYLLKSLVEISKKKYIQDYQSIQAVLSLAEVFF